MSKYYDNWEKLVGAVLNREKLRQLALSHSLSSNSINDESSCFSFNSTIPFHNQSLVYKEKRNQTLQTHDDATADGSILMRSLPGVRSQISTSFQKNNG
ncbi:hypothetical protein ACS0TY_026310 [Phlomoides rotata]